MQPKAERLSHLLMRAGVVTSQGLTVDADITSICDDSRKVQAGALFVAVRGEKVDGHQFIDAAIRAGAKGVVCERVASASDAANGDVAWVAVDDTRDALAKLAAAWFDVDRQGQHALRNVAVTGTNGKTTVAWMTHALLTKAGHSTALLGTVVYDVVGERKSSPLTTPGSLQLCECLHQAAHYGATHAVLEVSSHALDQKRTDGLHFDVAAFTNLTGDHLDYHGSMENYFAAKRRLFERLSSQSSMVLNLDDKMAGALRLATDAHCIRYSLTDDAADLFIENVQRSITGTQFDLLLFGQRVPLHIPFIGDHNLSNFLAAVGNAYALGMSVEDIVAGAATMPSVPGRLERVDAAHGDGPVVLVDYAHTDDAMMRVLQVMKPLTAGRLICVFGCGGDRDRTKRPRMARVAEQWSDIVIVTSDNPRTEQPLQIMQDIQAGFRRDGTAQVITEQDRARAIEMAIGMAQPADCVLIAGKGHEDYQIIGTQRIHFDDREVARQWLDASIRAGVNT